MCFVKQVKSVKTGQKQWLKVTETDRNNPKRDRNGLKVTERGNPLPKETGLN